MKEKVTIELERLEKIKKFSELLSYHPDREPLISMVSSNTTTFSVKKEFDLRDNKYIVSIIVPVYKTEEYLRKCLDSLINQSLKDIQIIAVNDGSPDNSLSIIEEYARKFTNVKVINQSNKGLGAARNAGIEGADGKYLMFLDSDDYFSQDACFLMASHAESFQCEMVIGKIAWDDDGKITLQENIEKKLGKYSQRRYVNLRNDTGAIFINVVCSLYSREMIINNGIRFPEGLYWEDMPFALQAWYHSKQIGFLNHIIYLRSRRENSITQTFNIKGIVDKVKIASIISSYFDEYRLHQMYNYFDWTIADIELRIKAIESSEDKKRAEEYWNTEMNTLIGYKNHHEQIYLSSKK